MACPVWPTHFSNTTTGTWEVMVGDRLHHVLWFQNRIHLDVAERPNLDGAFEICVRNVGAGCPREIVNGPIEMHNIAFEEIEEEVRWRNNGRRPRNLSEIRCAKFSGKGNCLIIPLMGVWKSIKVLNTDTTTSLLFDVSRALHTRNGHASYTKIVSDFKESQILPANPSIVISGNNVYDIAIVKNCLDIPSVLPHITEEKRPDVNEDLFKQINDWYQCPVAVCCFKNTEGGICKPIGFAFEPLDPDKILVCTLDGQYGVPDLNALVRMDHTIFAGSYLTDAKYGGEIAYSDPSPQDLRPYLLNRVMGMRISASMENGDFVFDTKALRAGHFEGMRLPPPYASETKWVKFGHSISREASYC